MSRIRTLNQAYEEIKANDPNTAISPHSIRKLILSGQLPAFQSGNKYLFDMEEFESYIKNPQIQQREVYHYGNIKPIRVK